MKNKKLLLLPIVGFPLLAVFLYVGVPEVSIMINRTFEMLRSGNNRGLMMIYYQMHEFAWLYAAFTYFIQSLSLIFSKKMIIGAGVEYFGLAAGTMTSVIGAVLATGVYYLIGSIFSKWTKHQRGHGIYPFVGFVLASLTQFFVLGYSNIIVLLCGIFRLGYWPTVVGTVLGQVAFIVWFIK